MKRLASCLNAVAMLFAGLASWAGADDGFRPRQVAPVPIGPAPYGLVPVEVVPVQPYGPVLIAPPVVQPIPIGQPAPVLRPVPTVQPAAPQPAASSEVRTANFVAPPGVTAPLEIEIGEGFANQFFARQQVEDGPVVDVILDADVRGWRRTTTNVSVDFVESSNGARFDVRATGTNNSDTMGATDRATVRTFGMQTFQAAKPVLFNGDRFLVQRARGVVNPANQTVGAWTRYDEIPIIGPIAQRTAYRKAVERQPLSEKIAADRLAERLFPEFNKEINDRLILVNAQLKRRREELVEQDLWPKQSAITSNDSHVRIAAWFSEDVDEAVEPLATRHVLKEDESRVTMHESLLAGLIDRLELGGRVVQADQLEGAAGSLPSFLEIERPAKKEADPEGAMAALVKFVLDEKDPVKVSFASGRILVEVRLAVRPAIGPDIGPINARIEVEPSATERDLVFAPKSTTVRAVDKTDTAAGELAKLIESRLATKLPIVRVPRAFEVPTSAQSSASLRVVGLRFDEGWCCLRVR